jgi:hypothetical protein
MQVTWEEKEHHFKSKRSGMRSLNGLVLNERIVTSC